MESHVWYVSVCSDRLLLCDPSLSLHQSGRNFERRPVHKAVDLVKNFGVTETGIPTGTVDFLCYVHGCNAGGRTP